MVLGLIKKLSGYYFRAYVPKGLIRVFNQETIDKSLKTKNKRKALRVTKLLELDFKYLVIDLQF